MSEEKYSLEVVFTTEPGQVKDNIDAVSNQVDAWLASFDGIENATDDQIKDVKKQLAELRKGKQAISKERIRIKKLYLQPLDAFEARIKPITDKIDATIDKGKAVVDTYEEQWQQERQQEIFAYWMANKPSELDVDYKLIFDDKWLNHSVSGKKWKEEIDARIKGLNDDIKVIDGIIKNDPDQGTFISGQYIHSANLGASMDAWASHVADQKRIEEMKQRAEAEKAAQDAQKQAKSSESAPAGTIYRAEEERPQNGSEHASMGTLFYDLTFHMEHIPVDTVRELNHFLVDHQIPVRVLEQVVTNSNGEIVKKIIRDKNGNVIEREGE